MKAILQILLLGISSFVIGKNCGNQFLRKTPLLDLSVPLERYPAGSEKRQLYPERIINTFFHVVSENTTTNVPSEALILDQLVVLNNGFAPYGFQFSLAGLDYHVNNSWAVSRTETTEYQMQSMTRNGTYADINLWFLSDYNPDKFVFDQT
jgi:hypothetical protein